jgi:hypothetical protein
VDNRGHQEAGQHEKGKYGVSADKGDEEKVKRHNLDC